jgi:hypothetical protein
MNLLQQIEMARELTGKPVIIVLFYCLLVYRGTRTMPQAGRSRDPIPDEMDFFFSIYLILPVALWPWGRLGLLQNRVQGIFLG